MCSYTAAHTCNANERGAADHSDTMRHTGAEATHRVLTFFMILVIQSSEQGKTSSWDGGQISKSAQQSVICMAEAGVGIEREHTSPSLAKHKTSSTHTLRHTQADTQTKINQCSKKFEKNINAIKPHISLDLTILL